MTAILNYLINGSHFHYVQKATLRIKHCQYTSRSRKNQMKGDIALNTQGSKKTTHICDHQFERGQALQHYILYV